MKTTIVFLITILLTTSLFAQEKEYATTKEGGIKIFYRLSLVNIGVGIGLDLMDLRHGLDRGLKIPSTQADLLKAIVIINRFKIGVGSCVYTMMGRWGDMDDFAFPLYFYFMPAYSIVENKIYKSLYIYLGIDLYGIESWDSSMRDIGICWEFSKYLKTAIGYLHTSGMDSGEQRQLYLNLMFDLNLGWKTKK